MQKFLFYIVMLGSFIGLATPVHAQNNYCTRPSNERVQLQVGSTRVQGNISPRVELGCNQTTQVYAFKGDSNDKAENVEIKLSRHPFVTTLSQGQSTPSNLEEGLYQVEARTPGAFGGNCSSYATIQVRCTKPSFTPTPRPTSTLYPTSTPTPQPGGSCTYSSTQARVQKDSNSAWSSSLQLRCGETFNIGSFHNHTGQFATDTRLRVTGPSVFWAYRLDKTFEANGGNAKALRALFPGTYTLHVTTTNQTGYACEERATVQASCPNWWEP